MYKKRFDYTAEIVVKDFSILGELRQFLQTYFKENTHSILTFNEHEGIVTATVRLKGFFPTNWSEPIQARISSLCKREGVIRSTRSTSYVRSRKKRTVMRQSRSTLPKELLECRQTN